MRQAGYLAAAAIYAMDHHIDRLREDHQRASQIGEVLDSQPFVRYVAPVETNIVIFELDTPRVSESEFMRVMEESGIRLIGMGQGKLRMVTHLDYTDAMHMRVLEVLSGIQL